MWRLVGPHVWEDGVTLDDLKHHNADEAPVNLMPLIDVVFILLVFFVVTSTFEKDQSLEILRPQSRSATETTHTTARLSVDRDQRLWLDGESLESWALESTLQRRFENLGARRVLLNADARLSLPKVVALIDRCNLAGATEVALKVEPLR